MKKTVTVKCDAVLTDYIVKDTDANNCFKLINYD